MQLVSQSSRPLSKAGGMLNFQVVYKSSNEVLKNNNNNNNLFILLPHFKFLLFIILVTINYINTIARVRTHN